MNIFLKAAVNFILFIIFMSLIWTGYSKQTVTYLLIMIAGLFGLIGMLWNYNRNHK